MTRRAPRILLPLLVGGLVAGGVAGLDRLPVEATRTAALDRTATSVAVTGAARVCPGLLNGPDEVTRLAFGAGGPPRRPGAPGTVDVGALDARASRVVDVPAGQARVDEDPPAGGAAAVVSARGGSAAGLVVEQVTRASDGPRRGYAAVSCSPPARDAWFVGATSTAESPSTLVVGNVDRAPALIDVTVFDPNGRVPVSDAEGIVVGARTRVTVPLERWAADERQLALHVHARTGRITSAVLTRRSYGGAPRGVEWLHAAEAPGVDHVLVGVPQVTSGVSLSVVNPGPEDARVRVTVSTYDAERTADGGDDLLVPAGRTVVLPLNQQLPYGGSVRVSSDGVPVLAGVLAASGRAGDRAHDYAWVGASPPLRSPAVVPVGTANERTTTVLYVTAAHGDTAVLVRPLASGGGAGDAPERVLTVRSGRTARLRLDRSVLVSPVPGAPPAHAARAIVEDGRRGPLLTVVPLAPGPVSVPDRRVLRDLETSHPR